MPVVALLALASITAFAKVHPVPLDEKTTDAQCLECHADRVKGKSVHTAIAMGCRSCHEVRIAKDVTRVTLKTATPVKLCVSCHANKAAADIKGHIHQPAVRDCLKCHDAHATDTPNQLLKASVGDSKDSNLCLGCHDKGLSVSAKGSRHAALDMGCTACHTMHKTGTDPGSEFRNHLTKPAAELCAGCHDPKDEALVKAHKGQPIAKADCLTCHDPHQSKSPKLLQTFLHNPFESGSCDMCHADAKDGKVVLTQKTAQELCVTCHAEQARKIASAKVQHPGAASDCTSCHNPHAGKTPGFLQPDPVSACLTCHPDQGAQISKTHAHQPASVQGCATCHEPHGGDNPKLLRAKTPNQLCLECHGPDRSPVKVGDEAVVTVFDGKVKLPEKYFTQTGVLPLKYGIGHPTDRHPVSDVADLKTKAVTPLNCLSCHQPHGSAQSDLLVKDQAPNMDFCRTCHANGLNLKSTKIGTN